MKKSYGNNWKYWVGGLLAALLFMGATHENWRGLLVKQQLRQHSSDMGDSLAGKYISARFAERHNDAELAAAYLAAAARQNPDDQALLERSYKMKVLAGNIPAALKEAEAFKRQNPKSFGASSLLAIGAVKTEDFVKAEEELKSVFASTGEGEKQMHSLLLPLIRAWVLQGQGRFPDARAVLEALPSSSAIRNFILYQKALIADVAGEKQEAAKHYEALLATNATRSYRLVQAAASFYLRIGRREQAERLVKEYNVGHPTLMLTLPEAPPIASAREGVAEFLMETANLLYGRNMQESAMIYLHLALYLRPELPYASYLLGVVRTDVGDYNGAITALRQVPEGMFHDEAELAIARAMERSGRPDDAKKLLEARLEKNPKDTDSMVMLGDLLLDAKDYKGAVKYYTRALESAPEAGERWAWVFGRAIAYERLGQWEKAEPDFMSVLEQQPTHPDVLNYLAYSWITMGKNLDKAKEMLETALASRPGDAHIVDSYGWVLYHLKDYAEAEKYMERAAELMPADATVNDHLGDVYWRMGRQREARYQWERALLFKPEPKDAEAIQRKLEKGLPPLP